MQCSMRQRLCGDRCSYYNKVNWINNYLPHIHYCRAIIIGCCIIQIDFGIVASFAGYWPVLYFYCSFVLRWRVWRLALPSGKQISNNSSIPYALNMKWISWVDWIVLYNIYPQMSLACLTFWLNKNLLLFTYRNAVVYNTHCYCPWKFNYQNIYVTHWVQPPFTALVFMRVCIYSFNSYIYMAQSGSLS